MFAQLRRRYLSASFIISSLMVLLPVAVEAADPRAGTVDWPANTAEVAVYFLKPMPSIKYSVAVMPFVPKLGGYSPTSVCTYFGIILKDVGKFVVRHKRCDTGAAVNVDERFQLDWIVGEHTQ